MHRQGAPSYDSWNGTQTQSEVFVSEHQYGHQDHHAPVATMIGFSNVLDNLSWSSGLQRFSGQLP